MKKYLVILLVSIFSNFCKAQVGAKIEYISLINRSQDGTPLSEKHLDDLSSKSWLYINGNTSIFRQLLPDSAIRIVSGGGLPGRQRTKSKVTVSDTLGSIYMKDIGNKDVVERMPLYNLKKFYVVKEKLKPIAWKVGSESKKIGKFTVTKAEADYYGRRWIAWYAKEIPISDGPWKLYGLPGLILEAYDNEQKFKFLLKQITIPYTNGNSIQKTFAKLNVKPIDKEEFINIERKQKANQENFLRSKMEAASGGEGEVNKIKFAETIEKY